MSLLDVRNLRVGFAGPRGWIQAVDSFSLTVEAGETVALVGESGSGKSVSALAIAGLLERPPAQIDTGEVLFDGADLLRKSERELARVRGAGIGYVFQDPTAALHPLMTVGEQLSEAVLVHEHVGKRAALERAVAGLAEVGIADPQLRLASFPHELSGGMRQRVMLAMALIARPRLLIADEPTTALDVTVQAQVMALLARLKRERGLAVLLITHDLALVSGFAQRTSVMYAGAVVESAPTHDLVARPAHPYTAALLASVPSLASPLDRPLAAIPGSPPDPTRLGTGCAFQPRCAFAVESCSHSRPAFAFVAGGAAPGAMVAVTTRRSACTETRRVLGAGGGS